MDVIQVAVHLQNDFQTTEAFNTLRTSVTFSGTNIRTIALTSCVAAEGKSTVSLQLAASLAQSGKRTVLLDVDLRKGTLASRLKCKNRSNGLTNFLTGMVNASEILYETDIPKLSVIFAGTKAPNPTELLCSSGFGALIAALEKHFDYVIIDSPPLGLVDDCAVMMPVIDGVLLVIDVQNNSRKVLWRVKQRIELANGKILGVVLNRVNMKNNGGYYGKKYGYGYY